MKKIAALLTVLVLLCSCRTTKQYISSSNDTTRIVHDTVRLVSTLRDTVHTSDSTFVSLIQKGCTTYVYRDRIRTRWGERIITDTVVRTKTDTVRIESVKEGKKEQKRSMNYATILLTAAIVLLAVFAAGRFTKQ